MIKISPSINALRLKGNLEKNLQDILKDKFVNTPLNKETIRNIKSTVLDYLYLYVEQNDISGIESNSYIDCVKKLDGSVSVTLEFNKKWFNLLPPAVQKDLQKKFNSSQS